MAIDHYAPCPCGSGKKFKWCCEPIYHDIGRAFAQESQGQHDTALRMMADVVAKHPQNPEAWGRQAQLLAANSKVEDAEEALQKAFALNPNYPYGLLLRAQFRYGEGEIAGALLLARKAAEAYTPEAREFLAEVYNLIFQCELRMHRPVAARAALRIVTHCDPSDEAARDYFEQQFGPQGRLPEAVRRDYSFLPPVASLPGERRAAWDKVLGGTDAPRLGDLARLFDSLSKEDSNDASAWFNLALSNAWLGDNRAAMEALQLYLDLENDEVRTTTAAALLEVLRFGQGLEDQCDYLEHSFTVPLGDPQAMVKLLQEWEQSHRLIMPAQQQEGMLVGLVLEYSQVGLITAGSAPAKVGRLAGYFAVANGAIRVWGFDQDAIQRLKEELRTHLNFPVGQGREQRLTAQFVEVPSEALIFPVEVSGEEGTRQILDHAAKYYEETWINKPRRSLSGNTPVDATNYPVLRKKLRGVIQFVQDCAHLGALSGYDFNRLRAKLGLTEGAPTPTAAGSGPVFGAMSAAELAALQADSIGDEQLEQAFQSAQRLDVPDLAKQFGKTLAGRPANPEKADRYHLYSYLTQRALKDGELDAALDYVNEGESHDCTHNEGRRRNDYELRRGQVHARRGEPDKAEDVFRGLIERAPSEMKYRTTATEAMLGMKEPAKALRFAEEGLIEARRHNDRDSEGFLMELASAARKQLG